jgi:hypothetical protein
MTLSNRLRTELIGEDELEALLHKHAAWNYSSGKQGSSNEVHYYTLKSIDALKTAILKRQALQPTIANIKADLKQHLLQRANHAPGCSAWAASPATAMVVCDCPLSDVMTAIDQYCKDEKI